MKIKRNIAMSLIKDLIQDEKFKKEMIDLISSTSDSSGIARHEEKKIFNNLLKVHKKNVDDVMVPRGEIIFIDEKIDKEDWHKVVFYGNLANKMEELHTLNKKIAIIGSVEVIEQENPDAKYNDEITLFRAHRAKFL